MPSIVATMPYRFILQVAFLALILHAQADVVVNGGGNSTDRTTSTSSSTFSSSSSTSISKTLNVNNKIASSSSVQSTTSTSSSTAASTRTTSDTTSSSRSASITPNGTITSPATLPALLVTEVSDGQTNTVCSFSSYGGPFYWDHRDQACCSKYNTDVDTSLFWSWMTAGGAAASPDVHASYSCCGDCALRADKIDVYYWPGATGLGVAECTSYSTSYDPAKSSTISYWVSQWAVDPIVGCDGKGTTGYEPVTAVIQGFTLTSPTPAIGFSSFYAYNWCGKLGGTTGFVNAITDPLLTFVSSATSIISGKAYSEPVWAEVNFADYEACTSDCHPRISIRYDHFGMGDWKGCDQDIYAGYYDPPVALSKVHDLGGDTGPTPAPAQKPTPPPKPVETASGDPKPVNNGGQPAQPKTQPSPSNNNVGGLVGIIQSINGPAKSPQPQPPANTPPVNNQPAPPANNLPASNPPAYNPQPNQPPANVPPNKQPAAAPPPATPATQPNSPNNDPATNNPPTNEKQPPAKSSPAVPSPIDNPPADSPAPTPDQAPAPVITINGQTYQPDSASHYIIGTQTLLPGGPTIMVSGTPVAIAPGASALIVGDATSVLPTPNPTPGPAVPAPLIVNGITVTPNGAGAYIVEGQTLAPSGPAITASGGHVISVSVNPAVSATALIVDGTTTMLPIQGMVPTSTGVAASVTIPSTSPSISSTSLNSIQMGLLIMQGLGGAQTSTTSIASTSTSISTKSSSSAIPDPTSAINAAKAFPSPPVAPAVGAGNAAAAPLGFILASIAISLLVTLGVCVI